MVSTVEAQALATIDVRDALPAGGVADILGLVDDLARLGEAGAGLSRQVEAVTGLRAGELQVLAAMHVGADHPRGIADETGQIPEAVEATLASLGEQGLVGWHAHEAATSPVPGLVHLTHAGRAAVEQAEGVQIRIADALASALGAEQTRTLRATLRAVATVMEHGHL